VADVLEQVANGTWPGRQLSKNGVEHCPKKRLQKLSAWPVRPCPCTYALSKHLSRKDEHFVDFIALLWYRTRKNVETKMGVRIDLSIDQLAEVLKQLGPDELADLEILLDKSELEKRSEEVKSGDYVTMEELESLRDV